MASRLVSTLTLETTSLFTELARRRPLMGAASQGAQALRALLEVKFEGGSGRARKEERAPNFPRSSLSKYSHVLGSCEV